MESQLWQTYLIIYLCCIMRVIQQRGFLLLLFCDTGVWTQGFEQKTDDLSHISSSFCSGYFGDRVLLLLRLAWTAILFYASHHSWDYGCELPSSSFFALIWGSCKLFCPGWPGTKILPISTSLLASDDRHMPSHPASGWDRVWWTFCQS
jgi:hypothetical protein